MKKEELKRSAIALALAAALMPSANVKATKNNTKSLDNTIPFTDVDTTRWSYNYVKKAHSAGVVNGVGDNKFNPTGTLTYAQFYAILTRAYYANELANTKDGAKWYDKYMTVAKKHNLDRATIVNDMNASVNRYEMALIISNLMRDQGYKLPSSSILDSAVSSLPDWGRVPEVYRNAVKEVYYTGIITGYDGGSFNGMANMTREQCATVYCRINDMLNLGLTNQQPVEKPIQEQNEQEKFEKDKNRIYPFAYVNKNTQVWIVSEGKSYDIRKLMKVVLLDKIDEKTSYVEVEDGRLGIMNNSDIKELPGDFIELDIGYQTLYIYRDYKCVSTLPVITGTPDHFTDEEIGKIYKKQYGARLRGKFPDGESWDEYVTEWCPTSGPTGPRGTHSAPSKKQQEYPDKFGQNLSTRDGSILDGSDVDLSPLNEYGSHGCVNLTEEGIKEYDANTYVGMMTVYHM